MSATIDISLLSTFVAVADAGSFTLAAHALDTTTATVSRRIATLEESLGSRLFHRTTRKVSLTSAGKTLYERSALHIEALRKVRDEFSSSVEEPAGVLKLTAAYDLGTAFLSSAVARFIALYPNIQVEMELGARVVDLGGEGFDIAFRGKAVGHGDDSLIVRPLVSGGEVFLYASPSYLARRGSPHKFGAKGHDWLILKPLRERMGFPSTLEPRVVANDFLFMRGVVAAGGGIVPLPKFVAEPFVANGSLVRVLPSFSLDLGGLVMLYSSERPIPQKIIVFRDFIVDLAAREWQL